MHHWVAGINFNASTQWQPDIQMRTTLHRLFFFLLVATIPAAAQVCPGGGPNFSLAVPFDPAWIYGCNTGTSCNGGVAFDNRVACLPITAMDACAPAPSCGTPSRDASNVWYTFFASSSTARISCFQNTSLVLGVQAFRGGPTCGSLTELGCALSSGPSSGVQLNLSGLTAGTLYYFRIFGSATPVSQRTGLYCFCGSTGLNTYLILPALVSQFTAQRFSHKIQLGWTIGSNPNNEVYYVERSETGEFFTQLPGAGLPSGESSRNYQYADQAPLSGINYYRLKHVYPDGHYDYSKTISVKAADPDDMVILANPVHQQLQVELKSPSTLLISDMSGKAMEVVRLDAGRQTIATGQLSNGMYLLQVIKGKQAGNTVQKFSVFR